MAGSDKQLIFIELNEVNFEYVRKYIAQGELPNFAQCFRSGFVSETTSEESYEKLEPWIQWVSAHTGLTAAEHRVFRLGDIVDHEIPQIWELLEEQGVNVAAISPLNAKNRTRNAAFFLPDPWTSTPVTGSALDKKFFGAISQAVNDNAKSRISLTSIVWLAVCAATYARPSNYFRYLSLVLKSFRENWRRAMVLDLLLSDMMIKLTRSKKPDFVTLFLNAGAHIQHHYLYSSSVYGGTRANPGWYVDGDADPVLDVFKLYDHVVGEVRKEFPEARLMLATALHQDPHECLTYYWRLVDHQAYLRKLNLPFETVDARMSRDFLIKCGSAADAKTSSEVLASIVDGAGVNLFEVDNRGTDLFVMLVYPENIPKDFEYNVGGDTVTGFRDDVAFVAIKNGEHNGVGYFMDLGCADSVQAESFPITELKGKIEAAMGI